MGSLTRVSVHGGHSGQFCNHASDTLEAIVRRYIDDGFSWVGITEHTPASSEALLYEDQRQAGMTPASLLEQFDAYMVECRRLQEKYKAQIQLFAAMEIETYTGYEDFVPYLIERYEPDYIVGSVHFVNDINFDYSAEMYERAAGSAGGIDQLYCRYFDLQYDMIKRLNPSVVGHFDLIRIFDPVYRQRLQQPEVVELMRRNLSLIHERDLILDFNLRALSKGASEPYVSESILKMVSEFDIKIVPGDDSHGLSTVGNHFDQGVAILHRQGFSSDWPQPRIRSRGLQH
jgi:histidinol-phosphatase (PHP family)